jgi:hypothetical protein
LSNKTVAQSRRGASLRQAQPYNDLKMQQALPTRQRAVKQSG